jgi:predicted transcriptional regulator
MLEKLKSEIERMGRHIRVAKAVADHQPIGIMKLSELLDLPSHRIRYSLRILEQMGYIRATPAGAIATPLAVEFLKNMESDIDEIIRILDSMKRDRGDWP